MFHVDQIVYHVHQPIYVILVLLGITVMEVMGVKYVHQAVLSVHQLHTVMHVKMGSILLVSICVHSVPIIVLLVQHRICVYLAHLDIF